MQASSHLPFAKFLRPKDILSITLLACGGGTSISAFSLSYLSRVDLPFTIHWPLCLAMTAERPGDTREFQAHYL
jgi:hypothetical protein